MIPKIKEDKIIRCVTHEWGKPFVYIIEKNDYNKYRYTVYMLIRDKKYRNKYFEVESVVEIIGRICSIIKTEQVSDSFRLKYWKDFYDIEN